MRKTVLLGVLFIVCITLFAENIYYVNGEIGEDTNTGLSWEQAFATLDRALEVTDKLEEPVIYIARGTYYPSSYRGIDGGFKMDWNNYQMIDRPLSENDYTFLIRNNVKIYGGFRGDDPNETIEERDLVANRTILNGNLKEGTHAYHVVTLVGNEAESPITPLLDGLFITGGSVDNYEIYEDYSTVNGQQVYIRQGGGIYALNASFTLTQSTVAGNKAFMQGGGIYIKTSSPEISYTTISGNTCTGFGGGIANEQATPTLSNATIAGNYTNGSGGGIYNYDNSQTTVLHSIIWGNIDYNAEANNIENDWELGCSFILSYSVIEGSSKEDFFDEAMIEGEEGTVYDRDPGFVNFVKPEPGASPTTEGDYTLSSTSPFFFVNGMLFAAEEITEPTVIPSEEGIIYVKAGAAGKGSSWEDAHPSLAEAIRFNNEEDKPYTIYIAAGTYTPEDFATITSEEPSRNNTFMIRKSMHIYGGFRGDGEETIEERDLTTNRTILSGKLTEDVFVYHVMTISGGKDANLQPYINGLTIRDGKADGEDRTSLNSAGFENSNGGGLYHHNAASTFEQVTFENNYATGYGGAIYNKRMYADKNPLTLTLRDVGILLNKAEKNGGGLWNQDLVAGERVRIAGNEAGEIGGGIFESGVTYLWHSSITGNKASKGGALGTHMVSMTTYEEDVFPTLKETLTRAGSSSSWETNISLSKLDNTLIADNQATEAGGAIYTVHNTIYPLSFPMRIPIITNSIVWSNYADGVANSANVDLTVSSNSLIYGSTYPNNNLFSQEPMLVGGGDPTEDGWVPNANGDYKVHYLSPAIGMAEGGGILAGLSVYDPFTVGKENILYVNAFAKGDGSGKDWKNATTSLADAIALNNTREEPYTLYVAKGTYQPKYRNGLDGFRDKSSLTDRDNTFLITNNQQIYGGFKGCDMDETVDCRNLKVNRTILNGQACDKKATGAAYHVVVARGSNPEEPITPLLDGLTISGGRADGTLSLERGNKLVQSQGGGLLNLYADSKLIRIQFENNEATTGGAIHNEHSSPLLVNALIAKNTAAKGGAMYNRSSSPLLTNATIADNKATVAGGGIYNQSSSVELCNTIVWGNRKIREIDNVVNAEESTSTYAYSLLEGGTEEGTIHLNPRFISGYYPQTNEAILWCGSVEMYKENGVSLFDADGRPRLSNNARTIYMGAFETLVPIRDNDPATIYHTIIVPEIKGVATDPRPGTYNVKEGEPFLLYITLDEDYSESSIRLFVNEVEVELQEFTARHYHASIQTSRGTNRITFEGVEKNSPSHNASPEQEQWQVYATSGTLRIVPSGKATEVSVYTATGMLCFSQTLYQSVDIPLAAGIYFVRAKEMNWKVIVKE
ncbi:right-handed parallel beta-helix repeat-containing protein [Parabacteroides sp. OttesenSCG-928-O15]|nr:right-handed parallel beta-helix repeat-containing protein [Parabacteroides sp. OttesenSCG-928-O15]